MIADADPTAAPDAGPARPVCPTVQDDPLLAEMDEILEERSERTRREDEY